MTEQSTSAGDQPQTRRSLRRAVTSFPASAAHPRRRVPAVTSARRGAIALGSLRSLAALAVVTGLIATFALPAYAAWQPADIEVPTLQQVASDDAQSLIVASDATAMQLTRESYAATTQEEIDQKKAVEAAAERARAAQVASMPF